MKTKNAGKFVKGQSGNPSGRPRQESALIRHELAKHSEAVIQKILDKALNEGDLQALKMILDRIAPPLKAVSLPSAVQVPEGATLPEMATAIIQQSINGELEPAEALQLLHAIAGLKPVTIADEYIKQQKEYDLLGF
jgi:hypothetical protein